MLNPLAECFYPSETESIWRTKKTPKARVTRPLYASQNSSEEPDTTLDATRTHSTELGGARISSYHEPQPRQGAALLSTRSPLLSGHGFFPPLPTHPARSPLAPSINTTIAPGPSTFREYLVSRPHATTPKAISVLSNACTLVTGDIGLLELLPRKPKPQLLLDRPEEILGMICEATILLDKRAGSSLLLTCKSLHETTLTAYGDAAKEYAKDQDPTATVLFEPRSNWNLYLDWMPRLLSRSYPILQLLDEADRLHNLHWVAREPLIKPFATSDALPVFKIGLYLLGMLHFRHVRDLTRDLVETFLDGLPGAALLVLRVTSVMMHALFCHQYSLYPYPHASRAENQDLIQEVEKASRRDNHFTFEPALVPCAFEKLLLTSGLRWPAYSWDHKDVWSVGDWDPLVETLGGTMRNIDYCAKLDQKHPVVVRMRASRYDIQISQRIVAEYPNEVGLLSQEWESVDRLLGKIGEWKDERSDLEILKELKAMTGL